ncbi:hypothetical protein ACH3VR_09920 [Microbacterium sp. B2969]|uniref:Uncharacterized protein n=1 Tax=Microbacterium alkaliflavum TaxID=3248839 RepID=A0ABW7Q8F5_9MICO
MAAESRQARLAMRTVVVASTLLVVVGLAVALTVEQRASFGWFAYAPLSQTVFVPGLGVWPQTVWGLILAGIGLVGLGFGVGWLVATRRR